jgi:ribosomal protein L37AE/L43A
MAEVPPCEKCGQPTVRALIVQFFAYFRCNHCGLVFAIPRTRPHVMPRTPAAPGEVEKFVSHLMQQIYTVVPMPWHCPACRTTITHNEAEGRPRPNVVYRCYVCRLELQLNEQASQLELVPLSQPSERDRDRN